MRVAFSIHHESKHHVCSPRKQMIRRDQMIGLLLDACPSYRIRWEAYCREPEFDADLLYPHLGDFADHVVDLLVGEEIDDLLALSETIERLHLEGDDFVKEAATIGLLEGIQNRAGHRNVSTGALEATLGAETRRWWRSLSAFWAGEIPLVGADIVKGSG
jgi:hypothetical protein